jgi:hypothetical protein
MASPARRSDKGPLNEQGCLFCLKADGGFTSREHILSESLGNQDKVLPPGIVCDRCNNGPLSRADHALIGFEPITLLRAARGLGGKRGKAIESIWGDAKVAYSAPGTLEVATNRKKVVRGMREFDAEKGVPGKLELTGRRPITPKVVGPLTRSIWKSAVEFIYLDHGPGVAFDPALDTVRDAVLDETGHGWLIVPEQHTITEELQFSYQYPIALDGKPALPIKLSVFGVTFVTDPMFRDLDPEKFDSSQSPVAVNIWSF